MLPPLRRWYTRSKKCLDLIQSKELWIIIEITVCEWSSFQKTTLIETSDTIQKSFTRVITLKRKTINAQNGHNHKSHLVATIEQQGVDKMLSLPHPGSVLPHAHRWR